MHDLAFADAARQMPVRILRLPMRAYSIGHELLLLAQRNVLLFDSFASYPAAQQRQALIRAVLVCYRSWRGNVQRERNLRLWGWLIRKSNWAAEIAQWRNYREAGSTAPPAPTQEAYEIAAGIQGGEEDRGRELGGSHLARLLGFATSVAPALGYETPYDLPLGLAQHLYLSALEREGDTRIENGRELQVRKEMEKHRADIAREREKEAKPCPP